MKKVVVIISTVFALFILSLLVFPYVYKSKIKEIVLRNVHKNIDAEVRFQSLRLGILRSFPDLNAKIKGFVLIGNNEFDGDTLLSFDRFRAEIDLLSLFRNEGLVLEKIEIINPSLKLIINEQGEVNYDIQKDKKNLPVESESRYGSEPDTEPEVSLKLESVVVTNFDFEYTSKKDNYSFFFSGMEGELKGETQGSKSIFGLSVASSDVNLRYDSIFYFDKEKIHLETRLKADLRESSFLFEKGNTNYNGVPLIINGGFDLVNDSLDFDIHFQVPELCMERLLAEVPDTYRKYINNIETDGDVALQGDVVGVYYKENYPAIDIDFNIKNGLIKYHELPDSLKIHSLTAKVMKAQGVLDSTKIGIYDLKASIAENPVEAKALFSSLLSDPSIDFSFNGLVDLENLSRVVPLGNSKLTGLLRANASIKGKYSDLEKKNYEDFLSEGVILLTDFSFRSSELPQGLRIQNASVELEKQRVIVKNLQARMGASDITLVGGMDNLLAWLFSNEELHGDFRSRSNLLDLNEFLEEYQVDEAQTDNTGNEKDTVIEEEKTFELPDNVFLNFQAEANRIYFDNMDISAFSGNITLRNQNLMLDELKMNLVGGQLWMDGNLSTAARKAPKATFNLDLRRLNLRDSYQQISMVNRYLPFAARSEGSFSTRLKMNAFMKPDLSLDFSSISAGGSFSTHGLKLVDAQLLNSLRSVVQVNRLRNLEVDDFTANYAMEDGNLEISPFETDVANQPVKIEGRYNLGGTLDFRVDAILEKALLSSEIQQMISYIPGHQRVKLIDVGLDIEGDARKPTVKVDTEKIKKQLVNSLKNSSQEDLEDAAKKLLRELFK